MLGDIHLAGPDVWLDLPETRNWRRQSWTITCRIPRLPNIVVNMAWLMLLFLVRNWKKLYPVFCPCWCSKIVDDGSSGGSKGSGRGVLSQGCVGRQSYFCWCRSPIRTKSGWCSAAFSRQWKVVVLCLRLETNVRRSNRAARAWSFRSPYSAGSFWSDPRLQQLLDWLTGYYPRGIDPGLWADVTFIEDPWIPSQTSSCSSCRGYWMVKGSVLLLICGRVWSCRFGLPCNDLSASCAVQWTFGSGILDVWYSGFVWRSRNS